MDLPRAKNLKSDLIAGLTTALVQIRAVMVTVISAAATPTPTTAAACGRPPGVRPGAGEPEAT
ncbi:MAG: hypothetical protein V2J16_09310 [Thermoleophilia bacterium]|jgi:hypothetical protein|nr:hypothetical protein [Thermoleophilia bacterium]